MNIYLNADCMNPETGLPSYPDNYFDLAIVDPPYGIGVAKMAYTQEQNRPCRQKNGSTLAISKKKYKHGDWDNAAADKNYANELVRVSKNQIIWGINYMDFHLKGGRIIWNKLVPEGVSFSDCEIAYCSMIQRVEIVHYMWAGMMQGVYCGKDMQRASVQQGNKQLNEDRIHPTHKPMALYRWLVKNYAKQGDRLLDTHVGSASSLIAFEEMGFEYVGYELDADYYRDSCKRLEAFRAQLKLFTGKEIFEASKPPELF